MKKISKTSRGPKEKTRARDEKKSLSSAIGAPPRGFSEDEEFAKYEEQGMNFGVDFDKLDPKTADPKHSEPSDRRGTESLFDYDEAEFVGESAGQVVAGTNEVYPGDPDIGTSTKNDLRFGGEDISGVSEWSLRATHLELDDGLDAGDFHRSDEEIRSEIFELLDERHWSDESIEYVVSGAEVRLSGKVSKRELCQEVESAIRDLPGVKEVQNFLLG